MSHSNVFSMRSHRRPDQTVNFTAPTNTSGRGISLVVGPGVSVYYDLQPPNLWTEHSHPVTQIVIALDPVRSIMRWSDYDGPREVRCTSPHVWIVAPSILHSVEWKDTGGIIVLYVEPDYVRAECGGDVTQCGVVPLAKASQHDYLIARLCRKFHDLCHAKRIATTTFVAASGALLAPIILRIFLQRSKPRNSGVQHLSDSRLIRITEFIETHIRDPILRRDLARVAGLSEHHFSRAFKATTGIPPMKYLWRCRIYRARQLLETGAWKVASAAAETGFFDQSHLDRQFRKEFGCAPGSVIPSG